MAVDDEQQQSSYQQQQQQPSYQQQQPYGQQPYNPQLYQQPQQYQPQQEENAFYQQPQQYQYQQQYQPQQSYQQQQPQQPHYSIPLPPQQPGYSDSESLINNVSGQPPLGLYEDEQDDTKMFPTPKYRDLAFGIAFLAHLALLLVITISAYSKPVTNYYSDNSYIDSSGEIMGLIFVILPLTIIFCVIFIYVWFKLARNHGEGLIKWSFIISIALNIGYTIYFFATGLVILGIIFAIGAVVLVIFFFTFRSKIPFTAQLLNNAVGIIQEFPSTLRLSYLAMFVNCIWFILWGSAIVRCNRVYEGGVQTCINIYLVFSLYWTFQVIKNTLHTTIAGLFATWYFSSGPNGVGMPSNPTLNSFRRATTTSFGSICFGSLIIAFIQTLRYITQLMMNNKNGLVRIIGFILNFFLGILESVLQFFNIYVFTHVAIYGEDYLSSAKVCGRLFSRRLGSVLINDNFISTTITISAFASALLLSIIGSLIGIGFHGAFYGGTLTLIIGFLIIVTSLETVYSGVVSLFVCYVLNPTVLLQTKPELYSLYSKHFPLMANF